MNRSTRAILSLSWQSLAYGVGVIGSQVVLYLMVPLLTRYMPKEEYGAVSVIMALYAFLNTLTNAGLPAATFRLYNDGPEEERKRVTLGSSQLLFFLFAAIPAAAIVLFAKPLSTLLLGSDRYALALQFAAGFLVLDTMNFFGTIILRVQVRPLVASIQSIILVTCETGLAVLFVVVYRMGVVGYWLGYLTGEVIGLMFTIWVVRKAIVFQVSRETVGDLMKFGIPLIPTAISMTALRLADRYFIGALASLDQVAVYDVGYKIGSVVSLLISPFRTAWMPFAFSIARKPEAPRIYRDVFSYLMAGCAFLILGAIVFRDELLHLMAPESYAGASTVVGWVAVSQLFLAAYAVFSIGPMIVKRTHDLAWAAVLAGGLNVLLNILLIPPMGILGAALATFASYLVLIVAVYFIGQRSYPISVDWVRLLKLAIVSGLVMLAIFAAEGLGTTGLMLFLIKAAGLCFFPILLLLTGFVKPAQGKALIATVRDLAGRKLTGRNE